MRVPTGDVIDLGVEPAMIGEKRRAGGCPKCAIGERVGESDLLFGQRGAGLQNSFGEGSVEFGTGGCG